mmetsp:Transcript_21538/g.39549  ORF Transcript_21538/g.39549 Transcript_21538/m.39549 type:complete len:99 (+) Transcript_21538:156-452(+)
MMALDISQTPGIMQARVVPNNVLSTKLLNSRIDDKSHPDYSLLLLLLLDELPPPLFPLLPPPLFPLLPEEEELLELGLGGLGAGGSYLGGPPHPPTNT